MGPRPHCSHPAVHHYAYQNSLQTSSFCSFWSPHTRLTLQRSLPLGTNSVVDLMESSSEVHYSGFHMDGLEQRKTGTEQPTTSETDMYKQHFSIESFDTKQLLRVMDKLKRGQAVEIPKYDFKSYKSDVFPARRVNPADVIILEGILVFHDPRLRALMNMKIFVDTDADVRLARRIKRDTAEKARDIGAVLDQ